MSDKAPVDPTLLSDDEVLAFTQKIRRRTITDLVVKMGTDPTAIEGSDKTLFNQLLDGLDRQALTNKRIKVEEESSKDMAGTAALIAELLTKLPNRTIGEADVIENAVAPVVGEDVVPSLPLLPGETDIAASQLSYDTFIANTPSH